MLNSLLVPIILPLLFQFVALEEKEDVAALVSQLIDGNVSERIAAAKSLGNMKSREAVPSLIYALHDSSTYVRGWAAWAIGEVGDSSGIPHILFAFEKYDKLTQQSILLREQKCLTDFYLALEKLTGKKFGLDVQKWKKWWEMSNCSANLSITYKLCWSKF